MDQEREELGFTVLWIGLLGIQDLAFRETWCGRDALSRTTTTRELSLLSLIRRHYVSKSAFLGSIVPMKGSLTVEMSS
jgi:hypothetical protein